MTDESRPVHSQEPASESALAPSLEYGIQPIATPEDVGAFQARLRQLLERRIAIYTMGDSTSVPKHVAVDLLRSVCFVLGIDPDRPAIPERLLYVDLEDEFRRRLAEVERKVELAGELWREANAAMPAIPNTALHDTIASIGVFPTHYDFRSMAHEIPVVFDYPLCHPVPDRLLGVDYINEYLRRLLLEFDLLGRFTPNACARVLERASPDYVDLLVNLYEPVAANIIGRSIIGKDLTALEICEDERTQIARLLTPLSGTELDDTLRMTASTACDAMGVRAKASREYLRAFASELLPRIEVALSAGDLVGVFL
jgi:hypothetical protein